MSSDGKTPAPAAKPRFTEKDIPALLKTLYQYLDKKYDVNYDDGPGSLADFGDYIREYVLEVDEQVRDSLDSE